MTKKKISSVARKKNQQDSTMRNVRAANKRFRELRDYVWDLHDSVNGLAMMLDDLIKSIQPKRGKGK